MEKSIGKGPFKRKTLGISAVMLAFAAFIALSSSAAMARDTFVPLSDFVKQQGVPDKPEIFKRDIKPFTLDWCARCHQPVYQLLKKKGTRHRMPCTFCHTKYHTFSPGPPVKVAWEDAIPRCQKCHSYPHGEKLHEMVPECNSCHGNAHSPLVINPDKVTANVCLNCHEKPPRLLKENKTKHSALKCTFCHTVHGYKPKCMDCHSKDGIRHTRNGKQLPFHIDGPPTKPNSFCLDCHDTPHNVLNLTFDEQPQIICGGCHTNPTHRRNMKMLRKANPKHNTEIECASCHYEHGLIPKCTHCHEDLHVPELKPNKDCLNCHRNPHKPLDVQFTTNEPQRWCMGCHQEQYDDLTQSGSRHATLNCSKCHWKHGRVPKCQECHKVPHNKSIFSKFKECRDCHGHAHKLKGRMHPEQ